MADNDLNPNKLLSMTNIAEQLDEDALTKIGNDVYDEYIIDEKSREDYIKKNDEWMKLALQVMERKNHPWPKASNVKYPLMTTAAVQFSARAYPALIKNPRMVRGKVTGKDADGTKSDTALRISKHMSYQVLEEMTEWEEDMDRLTITVPITGCVFKKTYFSGDKKRNCSELVYPKDLCINYYATDLCTASRVTHILELSKNEIFERKARGFYLDVDIEHKSAAPELAQRREVQDKVLGTKPPTEKPENMPNIILEQHRYLDLDDDGYQEPYIVTIDMKSKKVLRISPRFDAEGIELNEAGELLKIKPIQYFTKFSFIPNPDGGIYDVGFGILLGSLNETINTLINSLIDAGTLSNMQSGFIARGLRLKGGNKRFRPGEWKVVNSTGQDLKNGIFPLPVREPSNVLFLLLGTILESSEKLASIVDILTGENPGQNQAATTTLAVVEQGTKVFTAIHKRLYRALDEEFQKLFRLNSIYLKPEDYFEVLDDPDASAEQIFLTDYQSGDIKVRPSADPNISTEVQAIMKAQSLLELAGTGKINMDFAVRNMLEAQDQPNIEQAMNVPEPPPSIEAEEIRLKERELDLKERELDIKEKTSDNEAVKDEAVAVLSLAKAEREALASTLDDLTTRVDSLHKLADSMVKVTQAQQPKETTGEQ